MNCLPITTSDNFGVGALCAGQVEQGCSGANVLGTGVLWQEVVLKGGFVWRANTLAGHCAATKGGLETGADLGANDRALVRVRSDNL